MYKQKIQILINELSKGLYEREECLKLVLLSMFAGKSIFLFGPPGTAKSLIARRASLAFKDDSNDKNNFFAYLMNRFSTPEEIFGPIDIAELKKNNLTRKTDGYLPTANFVFLDEIWKSSPAILNTLLTIINERIYKDGSKDIKVPLKGIVCASNEFPPANQGLEALYDRMIVRYFVKPLESKENFEKLLFENDENFENVTQHFSNDDLEKIQNLSKKVKFQDSAKKLIYAIKAEIDLLRNSSQTTTQDIQDDIPYISDRRWKQCAQLLQICAVLSDRDEVNIRDVALLRHVLWENETQITLIDTIIQKNLMMINGADLYIKPIKDDYEKLVELCQKTQKAEHKQIASDLEQRANASIDDLKRKFAKQSAVANPFLSANDMDFAFSDYTQNIKTLQSIVLGAKELFEKSNLQLKIKDEKNNILKEFDIKFDEMFSSNDKNFTSTSITAAKPGWYNPFNSKNFTSTSITADDILSAMSSVNQGKLDDVKEVAHKILNSELSMDALDKFVITEPGLFLVNGNNDGCISKTQADDLKNLIKIYQIKLSEVK